MNVEKKVQLKTLAYLSALLGFLMVLPFGIGTYWTHVVIICFYYVVLACSWNLLAGYTGLFSLAHHAMAGVGGYTSALLAAYWDIPPAVGILLGGLTAMCLSFIIGRICLRLKGIYLAVATWAFGGAFDLLIRINWKWTRGDLGLPTPRLFKTASILPYYYTAFFLMLGSVIAMYMIVNSKIGLFIRSIREDEEAAATMAVDTTKWKTFIFSITGFFAGIMGAFRAHYIGLMSPAVLKFDEMIVIILMVIIGGFGNFWAPFIGAPFIEILSEWLRIYGAIRMILFASLVMLIARFFRGGLIALFTMLYEKWQALPLLPESSSKESS